MIQEVIVYIVIAVAVVAAVIVIYRHISRPEECAKHAGCTGCPLVSDCKKSDIKNR